MLHAVLELVGPQGTVQERALEDACRKEKGLWWVGFVNWVSL